MSSVHFKFRSGSEYEPLFFDGHCISLKELRELITEKKRLGRGGEFKLEIMDSTTEREYTNENEMIPKNASLIVRRVPIHYSNEVPIAQAEAQRAKALESAESLKLEALQAQALSVTDESEATLVGTGSRVPICYLCKQNGHVYKNCPIMAKYVSKGKEPVHLFLKR